MPQKGIVRQYSGVLASPVGLEADWRIPCYALGEMLGSSASRSSATVDSPVERLTTAVDHLAQNAIVLSNILDDIREDLSWLLRNGVPGQEVPATSTDVRRNASGKHRCKMTQSPRVVIGDGRVDDRLQCGEPPGAMIDDLVSRLAEPLGEIAQEQLNILVGVLESTRREIETTIRGVHHPESLHGTVTPPPGTAGTDARQPGQRVSPPPGFLF